MQEFLSLNYEWLRALHIIAIIAWMAGLLYLPRLFVYHAQEKKSSKPSEMLKIMEYRLLTFIMHPAMVASWLFGLLMLWANPGMLSGAGWMHAKLLFVVLMTGYHHALMIWTKKFANDQNTKDHKFYRIMNEVPTLFMIIIVIMAVVQPF